MSTKINYRPFLKKDIPYITEIIKETWNYEMFCDPKTAQKLSYLFLFSCLANHTYSEVVTMNHQPVGILLGNIKQKHRFHFYYRLKQISLLLSLYITRRGREVMKTFGSVNTIDKELLKQSPLTYDAEVAFFALSSKVRGQGLGKVLFQNYMTHMKSYHVKCFYLYTDTSCSYGFYEHIGMNRRNQINKKLNIKGQDALMSFFLYDAYL